MAIDIAAATNTAVRITLDTAVTQSYSREGQGTFLQFEGRNLPVFVKNTTVPRHSWSIEVVYGRSRKAEAEALLDLLETTYNQQDSRFVLRGDGVQNTNLSPQTFVIIQSWQVSRLPAGIVRITFTADEVDPS